LLDFLLSKVAGTDALTEVASNVVEQYAAPLFEKVRAELLRRVTGTPPIGFAQRLAAAGVPVDDSTAQILWTALVGAIADEAAEREGVDAYA
jgi:hypothetical protein